MADDQSERKSKRRRLIESSDEEQDEVAQVDSRPAPRRSRSRDERQTQTAADASSTTRGGDDGNEESFENRRRDRERPGYDLFSSLFMHPDRTNSRSDDDEEDDDYDIDDDDDDVDDDDEYFPSHVHEKLTEIIHDHKDEMNRIPIAKSLRSMELFGFRNRDFSDRDFFVSKWPSIVSSIQVRVPEMTPSLENEPCREAVVECEYNEDGNLCLALAMSGISKIDRRMRKDAWSYIKGGSHSCATSATFMNDRIFAMTSDDGAIRLIDLRRTDAPLTRYDGAHSDAAKNVSCIGDVVLSSGFDGAIKVWHTGIGTSPHHANTIVALGHGETLFTHKGLTRTVLSPDKRKLVVLSHCNELQPFVIDNLLIDANLKEDLQKCVGMVHNIGDMMDVILSDGSPEHVAAETRLENAMYNRQTNKLEFLDVGANSISYSGAFARDGLRFVTRLAQFAGGEVSQVYNMMEEGVPPLMDPRLEGDDAFGVHVRGAGQSTVIFCRWKNCVRRRLMVRFSESTNLDDFIKQPHLSSNGKYLASPYAEQVRLFEISEDKKMYHLCTIPDSKRAGDVLSCKFNPIHPEIAICRQMGYIDFVEPRF